MQPYRLVQRAFEAVCLQLTLPIQLQNIQTKNVISMRSPLDPIITDTAKVNLEKQKPIQQKSAFTFYWRYADEIFVPFMSYVLTFFIILSSSFKKSKKKEFIEEINVLSRSA